jgi:hypothetical protein
MLKAETPITDLTQEALSKMGTNNEMAEVMKELFDKGKIFLITDVSMDQIKIMTRIYMIAKMKNIPIYLEGLEFFCMALLSKDRKSRDEIVKTIGNMNRPNQIQGGGGWFGGRR